MGIDITVLNHALKSKRNRAKKHILVVEDDAFSRKLITNVIKDYEITDVGSGKDALSAYALYAPDVVLLDIEMPGMNGIEVLKEIVQADKESYVVMLTSHTNANIVKEAVLLGAKGYIAKPFSKEKVLQHILKGVAQ